MITGMKNGLFTTMSDEKDRESNVKKNLLKALQKQIPKKG